MQFVVAFFRFWLSAAASTNIRLDWCRFPDMSANMYIVERAFHASCAFPHVFFPYNVASTSATLWCESLLLPSMLASMASYKKRREFSLPENLTACVISDHPGLLVQDIIEGATVPFHDDIASLATI